MGKNSVTSLTRSATSRLGLHYFTDTLHYRDADLQTWLPELHDLGVSWLVLRSDLGRAIPEQFLRGLKEAGIEPVIQFQLSIDQIPDLKELNTLLEVYARWGARFVIFFDRPNDRKSWPAAGWAQQDLVERFLDRFLPAANLALRAGMVPVFPPLQPGGSYWDTAFLRSALQALQRRKQDVLLQNLVLSAYAWTGGHSLNWGAGGPARWPQARPYLTTSDTQDQCGFRIFEWYEAVARSVLERDCPIMLLQAGLPGEPGRINKAQASPVDYADTCRAIARLLVGETVLDAQAGGNELESLPDYILGCNCWLLSAEAPEADVPFAWFTGSGRRGPAAELLHTWRRERRQQGLETELGPAAFSAIPVTAERPIRHYLLLPGYEWGISDWYLEVIRPYVKKYRPTVGFSLDEAEKATWVTVVGNQHNFSDDVVDRLQKAGCKIEQISGDGTNIAMELAER